MKNMIDLTDCMTDEEIEAAKIKTKKGHIPTRTAGGEAQAGATWPEKELRCPDCGNIDHERMEKHQKYGEHLKCKSCGKEFLHVAFREFTEKDLPF